MEGVASMPNPDDETKPMMRIMNHGIWESRVVTTVEGAEPGSLHGRNFRLLSSSISTVSNYHDV